MPSPNKSWTVVLFTEDQTVEAVPSRWINGDHCFWPTVPKEKLTALLKSCEFNSCWPTLPVRVFRNATYDDFCIARAKATRAEETSELNTDADDADDLIQIVKPKRKLKKRIWSSSDDDSETSLISPKKYKTDHIKKKIPAAPAWQDDSLINVLQDESNKSGISEGISNDVAETSVTQNDARTTSSSVKQIAGAANSRCNPHLIHNIQSLLLDLHSKVDRLLTSKSQTATTINMTILDKSNMSFPMTTEEDINKLEDFISSQEYYAELVSYFIHQGGTNLYEFIRRCLAPLIEDSLCMLYSFTGKKGKREFNKLKISKAIIEAAEKVGLSNTKKDTEIKLGDWLRRAPERYKRSGSKS